MTVCVGSCIDELHCVIYLKKICYIASCIALHLEAYNCIKRTNAFLTLFQKLNVRSFIKVVSIVFDYVLCNRQSFGNS